MGSSLVHINLLNYNNAPYLSESLNSILSQTYQDRSISVSDDGSSDNSLEVLEPYRAKGVEIIARGKNSGSSFVHHNQLIEESKKRKVRYIGLFHADDRYDPSILQKQVDFLEKNPSLGAVITGARMMTDDGKQLWDILAPHSFQTGALDEAQTIRFLLQFGNAFFVHSSALYRREVFDRVGDYNPRIRNAGDLDYLLRVLTKGGGLGYIREPLMSYRVFTEQLSSRYDRMRTQESDFFGVMKPYLDRPYVTNEDRDRFALLGSLDQIHRGLVNLAHHKEYHLLKKAYEHFNLIKTKVGSQATLRESLGRVDLLKVWGSRYILKIGKTPMGPLLARQWLQWMDPRTSFWLRLSIQVHRNLRRG